MFLFSIFAQTRTLAASPSFVKGEEWEVLHLTNSERRAAGLVSLTTFDALQSAANVRSSEITERFDHTRPDGRSCFTALEGIAKQSAGENIAAGQRTPSEVVTGWMNSEGHRRNILSENFKHLGVGYTQTSSGYTHHWSQMFIGGCTTTALSIQGLNGTLSLAQGEDIASKDLTLRVTCNLHGESYMPLVDADYECDTSQAGASVLTIKYDGVTAQIPCYIGDGSSTGGSNGDITVPDNNTTEPDNNTTEPDNNTTAPDNNTAEPDNNTTAPDDNGKNECNSPACIIPDHGTFTPNCNMTREELIAALKDLKNISQNSSNAALCANAMEWARAQGLVKGVSKVYINPSECAANEQATALLNQYTGCESGSCDATNAGSCQNCGTTACDTANDGTCQNCGTAACDTANIGTCQNCGTAACDTANIGTCQNCGTAVCDAANDGTTCQNCGTAICDTNCLAQAIKNGSITCETGNCLSLKEIANSTDPSAILSKYISK